jgi:hypothetical protein
MANEMFVEAWKISDIRFGSFPKGEHCSRENSRTTELLSV